MKGSKSISALCTINHDVDNGFAYFHKVNLAGSLEPGLQVMCTGSDSSKGYDITLYPGDVQELKKFLNKNF